MLEEGYPTHPPPPVSSTPNGVGANAILTENKRKKKDNKFIHGSSPESLCLLRIKLQKYPLLYHHWMDAWTKRVESTAAENSMRFRYHTCNSITEILLISPNTGDSPAHCYMHINLFICIVLCMRLTCFGLFIKAANRQSEPANVRGWILAINALLGWICSQPIRRPLKTSRTVV